MHASPIARARRFMRSTKRGTLPAARMASAIAASLPDGSSSPCSSAPTLTRLPRGSRPTPEPVYASASAVMRALAFPGTRSTTTSAVIIFVSDAIGSTRVGRCRHRTRPVSTSNSRPARGARLKRSRTASRGSSSRTASGDGAVPPPASGAVPVSSSGPGAAGTLGDGSSTERAAHSVAASASTSAPSAGHRRPRRLRRPPCNS